MNNDFSAHTRKQAKTIGRMSSLTLALVAADSLAVAGIAQVLDKAAKKFQTADLIRLAHEANDMVDTVTQATVSFKPTEPGYALAENSSFSPSRPGYAQGFDPRLTLG